MDPAEPNIMARLRGIIASANALQSPIVDLGVAVDLCEESAAIAFVGDVNVDDPHDCPALLELRHARAKLTNLATSVQLLEDAVVKRRHAAYLRKLSSRSI